MPGRVEATVEVPARAETLFARLATLENHWDLADRWVEVVSLNGDGGSPADGGVVRLHGPLGLSRTARTVVDRVEESRLIEGTAKIGRRTRGRVSWVLRENAGGTVVTLRGELIEGAPLDRLIWALGGRAWLEGRLRGTLLRLRGEYGGPASENTNSPDAG